jgi:hypothetical protein
MGMAFERLKLWALATGMSSVRVFGGLKRIQFFSVCQQPFFVWLGLVWFGLVCFVLFCFVMLCFVL